MNSSLNPQKCSRFRRLQTIDLAHVGLVSVIANFVSLYPRGKSCFSRTNMILEKSHTRLSTFTGYRIIRPSITKVIIVLESEKANAHYSHISSHLAKCTKS